MKTLSHLLAACAFLMFAAPGVHAQNVTYSGAVSIASTNYVNTNATSVCGQINVTKSTGYSVLVNFNGTSSQAGNLTLYASNSIDHATWTYDPSRTIVVPFNGTSAIVPYLTNYTGVGCVGYVKYAAVGPANNGATNFTCYYATKAGQ